MNSSDRTLWNKHHVDYYSPEDGGGVMEEGDYKDGKKDGLWTYWYENGQKKREENYKGDKRNGLWTWWYENGQKELEGNVNDVKNVFHFIIP